MVIACAWDILHEEQVQSYDRRTRLGLLLIGLFGCSAESCSVVAHWLNTAGLRAALSSPTGSRPEKKNMSINMKGMVNVNSKLRPGSRLGDEQYETNDRNAFVDEPNPGTAAGR